MTHWTDIIDSGELDAAITAGHIRRTEHPSEPLSILSYTDRCVYERGWNQTTLACRGLIVRNDGTVVARPWAKFFNYGEPNAPHIDMARPAEVLEKVDGSLGILYAEDSISTRGSFTSDQAQHATEVLRSRYPEFRSPADMTVLFEIVYPENRIVCDYGDRDDLILLGAVRIRDGMPFGPSAVPSWTGPVATTRSAASLAEALALPPTPGAEGVVVRAGREMVKIKQENYLRLHRLLSGLNALTVWESIGAGQTVAEICEPLPDEFHPWVNDLANQLTRDRDAIMAAALTKHADMQSRHTDRKSYAAEAGRSPLRPWLFMLLDGKDPEPKIWRTLRPRGDQRPARVDAVLEPS